MITCTLTPLPVERERQLREWLGKPELDTLLSIVEAQEQKWECTALREAVMSREFPDKMAAANASFTRAHRYSNFLQVIKELLDKQGPFETAKLS